MDRKILNSKRTACIFEKEGDMYFVNMQEAINFFPHHTTEKGFVTTTDFDTNLDQVEMGICNYYDPHGQLAFKAEKKGSALGVFSVLIIDKEETLLITAPHIKHGVLIRPVDINEFNLLLDNMAMLKMMPLSNSESSHFLKFGIQVLTLIHTNKFPGHLLHKPK